MIDGVWGVAVLVLAAGAGAAVAQRFTAADESGRPPRLIFVSVTSGTVAAVFWLWALGNTLVLHFDLGVVSFALALGAAAYGAGVVESCAPLTSEMYKTAAAVGYGAVAATYVLGLFVVDSFGLRVYFALGTALWLAFLGVAMSIANTGGLSAEQPVSYSPI